MTPSRIPGQIFMLWDNPRGARPPIVDLCIPHWRDLNPNWSVFVLDGQEMMDLLRQDFSEDVLAPMTIQTKSDLLRLKLLSERGGVWADATCLPLTPLFKWFHLVAERDFSAPGFMHLQKRDPDPIRGRDYATWFMASQKGGYVVSRLYERFIEFFQKPRFPLPYVQPLQQHIDRNWRQFVGAEGEALAVSPYFAIHYLTALEIERDAKFRDVILQSAIPVGVWNYVMSRMTRVGTPQEQPNDLQEALRFVHRAPAPFNKLDWKVDCSPPWHKVSDILAAKRPGRDAAAHFSVDVPEEPPRGLLGMLQDRLHGKPLQDEDADNSY